MTNALKKTLELFNLTRIDRDLYSWTGESVGFQRIFGGQIMAQCLIAGYQTVTKERMAHSFHSYFLRPGDFNQNIIFEVDRIRDGKSFTTRRVNVIQNGEAIFSCSISFQKREKGLSHQIKMSDIPGPEKLKSDMELRKNLKSKIPKKYLPMWLRDREIETRQVEEVDLLKPQKLPPYRNAWMKPNGKLPTNERIHQALLLYVSDMGLLGSAINPHEVNFMSKNFQSARLLSSFKVLKLNLLLI